MPTPASYVAKITIKSIGGEPAKLVSQCTPLEPRKEICRIIASASGTEAIKDPQSGEVYTSVVGEFMAVNSITGEIFKSSVLYLPTRGLHQMVVELMKTIKEGDFCEFAFCVDVTPAKNPAGYTYVLRALQEPPAKSSRLLGMVSRFLPATTIDGTAVDVTDQE